MTDHPRILAGMTAALAAETARRGLHAPTLKETTAVSGWSVECLMRVLSPTLYWTVHEEIVPVLDMVEMSEPWTPEDLAEAQAALAADDPAPFERFVLWFMLPILDEQQRLRDAAARLGVDTDDTADDTHVVMDRLVRGHLERHVPSLPLTAILELDRRQVRWIELDGVELAFSSELVAGDPPMPMLLVDVPLDGLPKDASFDGRALDLPNVELPEIMLDSVAGRPLREIVDVASPLGDRIVESIENWIGQDGRPTLHVVVNPDPVPARWKADQPKR